MFLESQLVSYYYITEREKDEFGTGFFLRKFCLEGEIRPISFTTAGRRDTTFKRDFVKFP